MLIKLVSAITAIILFINELRFISILLFLFFKLMRNQYSRIDVILKNEKKGKKNFLCIRSIKFIIKVNLFQQSCAIKRKIKTISNKFSFLIFSIKKIILFW